MCTKTTNRDHTSQAHKHHRRFLNMATTERKEDFKGETGHVEYSGSEAPALTFVEDEVELTRSALIRTWLIILVNLLGETLRL